MKNPLEFRRGSLYSLERHEENYDEQICMFTSRIIDPGAFQYQNLYFLEHFLKTFTFETNPSAGSIELVA